MTMKNQIKTKIVAMSPEEVAHGRAFFELNILHGRVNPDAFGTQGDVFLSTAERFTVADTEAVRVAIRNGRLVEGIEDTKPVVVDPDKIEITVAAKKAVKEHDLDINRLNPTGKNGAQITKADVDRYMKALVNKDIAPEDVEAPEAEE